VVEHHAYFSACAAVVLGGLLAYAYTSYLNHLSAQNDLINDYLADLHILEELCVQYWIEPQQCSRAHSAVGHHLRAKLQETSYHYTAVSKILGPSFPEFEDLDGRLFDAATGGRFQSKHFFVDPERFSEVHDLIAQQRSILRAKKCAQFWAR
jgi:hypothetical protein